MKPELDFRSLQKFGALFTLAYQITIPQICAHTVVMNRKKALFIKLSLETTLYLPLSMDGCTVAWWLALSPHRERFLVQHQLGPFCEKFASSPRACIGFLHSPNACFIKLDTW